MTGWLTRGNWLTSWRNTTNNSIRAMPAPSSAKLTSSINATVSWIWTRLRKFTTASSTTFRICSKPSTNSWSRYALHLYRFTNWKTYLRERLEMHLPGHPHCHPKANLWKAEFGSVSGRLPKMIIVWSSEFTSMIQQHQVRSWLTQTILSGLLWELQRRTRPTS